MKCWRFIAMPTHIGRQAFIASDIRIFCDNGCWPRAQHWNSKCRSQIVIQMDKRKVVVITGASAGVGRATACAFAREGASVGVIARDEQRLEATRKEIEHLGGHALVLPADVADSRAIEAAAERVERELGAIDIWDQQRDDIGRFDPRADSGSVQFWLRKHARELESNRRQTSLASLVPSRNSSTPLCVFLRR